MFFFLKIDMLQISAAILLFVLLVVAPAFLAIYQFFSTVFKSHIPRKAAYPVGKLADGLKAISFHKTPGERIGDNVLEAMRIEFVAAEFARGGIYPPVYLAIESLPCLLISLQRLLH